MAENNNPSLRPVDNDSLTGLLRHTFSKYMQDIGGALPAQVIAYEPGTPDYVQVQPLIKVLGTSGDTVSRAQISKIPVVQIGAGGFILHFNIKTGDQGLIIVCDRDISLYLQSGQESPPNTYRKKDYADSFFLPCVMRNYTIAGEDQQNMVLQTNDGSIKISLFNNKIKITGDTEFTDDVLIDGNLRVNGEGRVYGDFMCGGNITAAGSITPFTPIPP